MKCRSAVVYEYGGAVVVEDLNLAPPKDGEVLVRMGASGICQSDWSVVKGTIRYDLPIVLGHEGAGVIEAVGQGVTYVKPGDHAILSFVTYCGLCRMCQSDRVVLCEGILANSGFLLDNTCRFTNKSGQSIPQMARIGTMSNYAVVSENSLIKISSDYSLEKAALVGCGVTTGIGAVINTAQVESGEWVAVIGVGGVGLNVIQGAKLVGARRIIGVDLNVNKQELATQFGMTDFVNPSEVDDVVDHLIQMTGGGVDYSFECIGNVNVMRQALECCHKGWGQSCIIGVAGAGQEISTRPFQLVTGRSWRGTAFGGARGRTDVPKIVDWYMEGKIHIDEMITHTMPLTEINTAFDLMHEGKSIRSVVTY